ARSAAFEYGRSAPLRRDLRWLWRNVWPRRSHSPGRSLGHRRLYACAAIEPACKHGRSPAGRKAKHGAGEIAMTSHHKRLLATALFGLGGIFVGIMIDPKTVFASYLVAWTEISAVPIGALAVFFTIYLVRAGWTHDLHGSLSPAALTMPVVAVLFIP